MQHHPAIDPGTIGVFRVVLTRLGPLEIWGPLHLVAILLSLVAIVLCILDLPLGPPKGWQWGSNLNKNGQQMIGTMVIDLWI